MHGHCRKFLLSPCCVWLPFQLPLHFATTRLKMIGDELGACPGQVGRRASVPGKDRPCGRVYFDTGGGHSRACLRRGACQPFQDVQIIFFIDFTVASILPLLCGYRGVDLMCVKPHCLAKSRNFFDVNCGPSSDQNMSGTPVQQNDCLTTLMRWGAVVSWPVADLR